MSKVLSKLKRIINNPFFNMKINLLRWQDLVKFDTPIFKNTICSGGNEDSVINQINSKHMLPDYIAPENRFTSLYSSDNNIPFSNYALFENACFANYKSGLLDNLSIISIEYIYKMEDDDLYDNRVLRVVNNISELKIFDDYISDLEKNNNNAKSCYFYRQYLKPDFLSGNIIDIKSLIDNDDMFSHELINNELNYLKNIISYNDLYILIELLMSKIDNVIHRNITNIEIDKNICSHITIKLDQLIDLDESCIECYEIFKSVDSNNRLNKTPVIKDSKVPIILSIDYQSGNYISSSMKLHDLYINLKTKENENKKFLTVSLDKCSLDVINNPLFYTYNSLEPYNGLYTDEYQLWSDDYLYTSSNISTYNNVVNSNGLLNYKVGIFEYDGLSYVFNDYTKEDNFSCPQVDLIKYGRCERLVFKSPYSIYCKFPNKKTNDAIEWYNPDLALIEIGDEFNNVLNYVYNYNKIFDIKGACIFISQKNFDDPLFDVDEFITYVFNLKKILKDNIIVIFSVFNHTDIKSSILCDIISKLPVQIHLMGKTIDRVYVHKDISDSLNSFINTEKTIEYNNPIDMLSVMTDEPLVGTAVSDDSFVVFNFPIDMSNINCYYTNYRKSSNLAELNYKDENILSTNCVLPNVNIHDTNNFFLLEDKK